ncbi:MULTISPECIES: hypothetical protein [unclassified Streptomyces]|uniref:hypothetical protein n=1 Tax=unclassified Streptomyces TaxID=2593676 RepID=UPI0036E27D31
MRRWSYVTVFLGLLIALLPVAHASADDACAGSFSDRVECWTRAIGRHTVTVTLDRQLPFDGTRRGRSAVAATVLGDRHNLEVQVPEGGTTGEGGTALLVLAGHRLVHPQARISRLSPAEVTELESVGACAPRSEDLCDLVGPGAGKQLAGGELIGRQGIAALPRTEYSLTPATGTDPHRTEWLLIGTCALLALLLTAFTLAVRRTRTAPAAGAAPAARAADEPTRPLRTPSARAGRRRSSGAPSGAGRPAVVRTDLHPQGYVELDRVLYRAVWAEPGQAPPPPGSRVEVTDAPEPDSDVLYAFPPAAGRHAHAR